MILKIAFIVPAVHRGPPLPLIFPPKTTAQRGEESAYLCAKQRVSLLPAPPCMPLLLRSTGSLYNAAPAVCSRCTLLPAHAQTLQGAVPSAQDGGAEGSEMTDYLQEGAQCNDTCWAACQQVHWGP